VIVNHVVSIVEKSAQNPADKGEADRAKQGSSDLRV